MNWLSSITNGMRKQEICRKAFALRMGLLDESPKTLEAIASEFGLTRERVRQIVKLVEKNARNPLHVMELRPLIVSEPAKFSSPWVACYKLMT